MEDEAQSLDSTFGALLISVILISMFFGVLTVQTVFYYGRFRNDPTWQKVWVALVFLVQAIQSAISPLFFYHWTISHWTDRGFLAKSQWEVSVLAACVATAQFLSQTFYARRSYILNKTGIWYWTSVIAFVLASSNYAMGLATLARITRLQYFRETKAWWYTTYWFAGSVVVDFLVTGPVALALHRERTVFSSTNDLLKHIIVWVVTTGILTSTLQTIVLILYFLNPTNLVFIALSYTLASLYANTFLAFLNRRSKWEMPRGPLKMSSVLSRTWEMNELATRSIARPPPAPEDRLSISGVPFLVFEQSQHGIEVLGEQNEHFSSSSKVVELSRTSKGVSTSVLETRVEPGRQSDREES